MTQIKSLANVLEYVWSRCEKERIKWPTIISGVTANARIDDGRWIVDCANDKCRGAMMVDKSNLVAFCFSCHNEYLDGHWLKVVMPSNVEEIETDLLLLPHWGQNWTPD